jgi:hypothetical protein
MVTVQRLLLWVEIVASGQETHNPALERLDDGERAAIEHAARIGAELILMDDRDGVAVARADQAKSAGDAMRRRLQPATGRFYAASADLPTSSTSSSAPPWNSVCSNSTVTACLNLLNAVSS